MKTLILDRKGISPETVALVSRLIALIPWPERQQVMGDGVYPILVASETDVVK